MYPAGIPIIIIVVIGSSGLLYLTEVQPMHRTTLIGSLIILQNETVDSLLVIGFILDSPQSVKSIELTHSAEIVVIVFYIGTN